MVSKLKALGGYSLVCVYLYMGMCLIALLLLSFMTNKVEYIYSSQHLQGAGHIVTAATGRTAVKTCDRC